MSNVGAKVTQEPKLISYLKQFLVMAQPIGTAKRIQCRVKVDDMFSRRRKEVADCTSRQEVKGKFDFVTSGKR